MERRPLILGLSFREQVISEIEQRMKDGELVVFRKEFSNQTLVGQIVGNRLGKDLILAPAPSYAICGTGYQPDILPLYRKESPITFRDWLVNDRVKMKGVIAVGNKEASEFFTTYSASYHYDNLRGQIDFLRVTQELKIAEDKSFLPLQCQVAQEIIEELIGKIGDYGTLEVSIDTSNRGDLIYVASKLNKDSVQEFIRFLDENMLNEEILRALRDLINTGLYHLGLKAEMKKEDGQQILIDIDDFFQNLADRYHPSLDPTEIPNEEELFSKRRNSTDNLGVSNLRIPHRTW